MSCRIARRSFAGAVAALPVALAWRGSARAETPTAKQARALAREAYIYGYPMVDNYRIQHAYFVDRGNPDYKAPYNELFNIPRVYTPQDRAIQTPNSDTPYSWIGLDLRAEPMVFTVPPIEKQRYWSLQLIDLYTHNFDYLGTRTTGNGGGSYMIAGPRWRGETPRGIEKVIRCETEIASAQFRTQLFDPADLENVKRIQSQYLARPLSSFRDLPAPKLAPIDFIEPLTPQAQRSSLELFDILNWALQFAPAHPSEQELMKRFALIGVGAGQRFHAARLSQELQQAMQGGIEDAWRDFDQVKQAVQSGRLGSADLFGTRGYLQNNYRYRMAGAALGIYGNSKEEALYPAYYVDGEGRKLEGTHRYILRFAPGQLPPVNAFWSLTMYDQPDSLLVENPIDRYLLNSTMLPGFKRDADGGLSLLLQRESPGKELEANWLPAPAGPFSTIMRLYLPKAEALDGRWKPPPLKRVA